MYNINGKQFENINNLLESFNLTEKNITKIKQILMKGEYSIKDVSNLIISILNKQVKIDNILFNNLKEAANYFNIPYNIFIYHYSRNHYLKDGKQSIDNYKYKFSIKKMKFSSRKDLAKYLGISYSYLSFVINKYKSKYNVDNQEALNLYIKQKYTHVISINSHYVTFQRGRHPVIINSIIFPSIKKAANNYHIDVRKIYRRPWNKSPESVILAHLNQQSLFE